MDRFDDLKQENIVALMLKASLLSTIKDLIKGFDDEQGVTEPIYEATKRLITFVVGSEKSEIFVNAVDACDGRYYIGEGAAETLFDEIAGKGRHTESNIF